MARWGTEREEFGVEWRQSATRNKLNDLRGRKPVQMAVHDQGVDEPAARMEKCSRQLANHLKSQAFPQLDRALVRAYNEIELHCAEASLSCALHRVPAHRRGDPAPGGVSRRHIPAVGHVRA